MVSGAITVVEFALMLAAVHEEVTVTATGRETTAFDAFNNVQVLDSIDLPEHGGYAGRDPRKRTRSGQAQLRSWQQSADHPGLRQRPRPDHADGVRTGDLSSQSGDHGVSVDPAGLQKIEILKGPATLLYGSNAIGGVVNAITPQQQFYNDPPQELRGQVNGDLAPPTISSAAVATSSMATAVSWPGPGPAAGGRAPIRLRRRGGELQTEQLNGRIGAGWFTDTGWISGGYQIEDGLYGVPSASALHAPEEGDAEDVRIELDQRRQFLRLDAGLRDLGDGPFESIKGSFSHIDWEHDEVENFVATGEKEIGTTFKNKTTIGRVEVQQAHAGRLNGQFGVWGQYRDYEAIGEEAISPPTTQPDSPDSPTRNWNTTPSACSSEAVWSTTATGPMKSSRRRSTPVPPSRAPATSPECRGRWGCASRSPKAAPRWSPV